MPVENIAEAPLPYQQELSRLGGVPTEALFLIAAVVVTMTISYLQVVRRRPRLRHCLRTMSALGGVATAVLVVAWGTLQAGRHQTQVNKHAEAIHLMRTVAPMFDRLGWVEAWKNSPNELVAEAASTAAIKSALGRNDLSAAVEFTAWPQARSPEGRRMRSAILVQTAAGLLGSGRWDEAEATAHKALVADNSSPVAHEAVLVARVHAAIRDIGQAHYGEAIRRLTGLPTAWRSREQAAVIAQLARAQMEEAFGSKPADLDRALSATSEGWTRAQAVGEAPMPLQCDMARALEAVAQRTLVQGRAADAVPLLARVESFVQGSKLTQELLPIAIHLRALDEIEAGNGAAAVASLEQALQYTPRDGQEIRAAMVPALALRVANEMADGQFHAAVATAAQASRIEDTDETRELRFQAHFGRGQWAARTGQWTIARVDLEMTRSHPMFAVLADQLLRDIQNAPEAVARVRRAAAWLPLPDVRGRIAVDGNSDGAPDDYVYTGSSGEIVGWSSVAVSSEVTFGMKANGPAIVLRDTGDRDTEFDEFIRKTEDGSAVVIIDVDSDARPDVRLNYKDDCLVSEEPLSGRVLFRIVSAAIGAGADFITAIDPYIVLQKNRVKVLRTPTARNTQLPTWKDGVVIDYRFNDVVTAQIYDEDILYDDFIDSAEWHRLPSSGMVTTGQGLAVMDVKVSPSERPEGFVFSAPPEHSAFADPAPLPDDARIRAIVASARRLEAKAEVESAIARIVATELFVQTFVGRASWLVQFAIAIGVDSTVMEGLFAK